MISTDRMLYPSADCASSPESNPTHPFRPIGLVIPNKSSEGAERSEGFNEANEKRIKKLEAEKSELARKLQEKSNALQELVSQVPIASIDMNVLTLKQELF